MIYPGDLVRFFLSITNTDGSDPDVTVAPVITIVRARDGQAVVTAAAMTLVAGTQKLYQNIWDSAGVEDGEYYALVSYVADGVTVSNRFLNNVRLGDSRVTGVVALDATVAKEGTTAKDATVAHASDLAGLNPDNSSAVQSIKAKTDLLPNDPASETTLASVLALLVDLNDATLGSWRIDKTVNPQTITFLRPDGSTLASFSLSESDTESLRTRR